MMRHKTRLSCFVFCFNQDSSRCSPLAISNTALQRLKVLCVVTEVTDISLFPFHDWPWFSAVPAWIPSSLAFKSLCKSTSSGASCFTIEPVHEKEGGKNEILVCCAVTQSVQVWQEMPTEKFRRYKRCKYSSPWLIC